MDEWICEQCGEVYDSAETALDCGWWDWIYSTEGAVGAHPAARAA